MNRDEFCRSWNILGGDQFCRDLSALLSDARREALVQVRAIADDLQYKGVDPQEFWRGYNDALDRIDREVASMLPSPAPTPDDLADQHFASAPQGTRKLETACAKCRGSGVVSAPYELDAEDCPSCKGSGRKERGG